ncbi:MAG: hypothetical protein IPP77_07240 [Bacteroidetes bacterium]|nr:hypothetical protein [Bacteroidota bacterium]
MKYLFFLLTTTCILSFVSCKRACYRCTQYCAYCISKTDSSISYKICANAGIGNSRVDAERDSLQASNHYCSRLVDEKTICDSKSGIDDALVYFQKQDYYCTPKE